MSFQHVGCARSCGLNWGIRQWQGNTRTHWKNVVFSRFWKSFGGCWIFLEGCFFVERHQAYIKRCKPCNLNPNKRHLTWCVVVPPSSEPLFAKASSWCHLHYLTSQQMNCSQPAAPFMCMYIRIYTSHQRFQLSVDPNMSIGIGMLRKSSTKNSAPNPCCAKKSGQQIWSPKRAVGSIRSCVDCLGSSTRSGRSPVKDLDCLPGDENSNDWFLLAISKAGKCTCIYIYMYII